jgi:hypothetical protein
MKAHYAAGTTRRSVMSESSLESPTMSSTANRPSTGAIMGAAAASACAMKLASLTWPDFPQCPSWLAETAH